MVVVVVVVVVVVTINKKTMTTKMNHWWKLIVFKQAKEVNPPTLRSSQSRTARTSVPRRLPKRRKVR